MNFVSAGLRKTAAEEKQLKGEGGSDDSDDDGPAAPPPSRAPKKLQMVNLVMCDLFVCTLQINISKKFIGTIIC